MTRAKVMEGRFAIAAKALLLAVPLVALKWAAHAAGWERIEALNLLTALLGGVIFTLAIMLSGVFADFKESERLVSELATTLRRVHADLAVVAQGERLAQMRRELAQASALLTDDLRRGEVVRMRRILEPLDRLDALVAEAARLPSTPSSPVRTVQVGLGTIVRAMDRLETIVETTFLRAGYVFAGATVAAGIGALTFADVGALPQALALHAFACFLLLGLILLIYDLDNPFTGAVHASIAQLEKVDAWLQEGAPRAALAPAARS